MKGCFHHEFEQVNDEVRDQHNQCKPESVFKKRSLTYDDICKQIVQVASSASLSDSSTLIDFGLAYHDCEMKLHLSTPLHLWKALYHLIGEDGSDWSRLEEYTFTFLQCGDQSAHNCTNTVVTLPKALHFYSQLEFGNVPFNLKHCTSTSILRLISGHAVIDHILFQPAAEREAQTLYFIQTSKQAYGRHNKKRGNLLLLVQNT